MQYLPSQKEMKSCYLLENKWNQKPSCSMKLASLRKLNTALFLIYGKPKKKNISKGGRMGNQEADFWRQEGDK